MRVLFCGGGTAGHVNPALAVAEAVKRNIPNSEVAYVVTEEGIENKLVSFKKYCISVSKFERKISLSNFKSVWKMLKAYAECKRIIEEFKPDVIFGTGGYATYPVICAGHNMGIKTIVHESNAVMGRALRALGKKADIVLLNFGEAKRYVKKGTACYVVGNPVRGGFSSYKSDNKYKVAQDMGLTVLCIGGSMGAERINDAAVELMEELIVPNKSLNLVLSTGKRDFDRVNAKMRSKGFDSIERIRIYEYIADMATALSNADIVISRAGAATLSELSISGKCAILIPSPYVADNHQVKNALSYVAKKAAIMVEEGNIEALKEELRHLIANEAERTALENNIMKLADKDASKEILGIIIGICSNNK